MTALARLLFDPATLGIGAAARVPRLLSRREARAALALYEGARRRAQECERIHARDWLDGVRERAAVLEPMPRRTRPRTTEGDRELAADARLRARALDLAPMNAEPPEPYIPSRPGLELDEGPAGGPGLAAQIAARERAAAEAEAALARAAERERAWRAARRSQASEEDSAVMRGRMLELDDEPPARAEAADPAAYRRLAEARAFEERAAAFVRALRSAAAYWTWRPQSRQARILRVLRVCEAARARAIREQADL